MIDATGLRVTLRSLARAPVFTITVIAVLATGMGAATAVFSVFDAAILRPLEYASPEKLLVVRASQLRQSGQSGPPSYSDFKDWRAEAKSVSGLAFTRATPLSLRTPDGMDRRVAALVSEGFFSVLGAQPVLGRVLRPDEESVSGPLAAVLSYRLWVTRFASDSAVVGRDIQTDRGTYTIVGVMPKTTVYPAYADLWVALAPIAAVDPSLGKRDYRVDNQVLARMKDGVLASQVTGELAEIAERLAAAFPETNKDWGIETVALDEEVVGQSRRTLRLLLIGVGLLLLIACANAANLMLVRGAERSREIALRMALGAEFRHVVRQMMMESLTLAILASLVGVPLAVTGVRLLIAASPASVPRVESVTIDVRTLAFSAIATFAVAIIFGLFPALQAGWTAVAGQLREGSSGSGTGTSAIRQRNGIVMLQVALAVSLLMGASLLAKSLWRLDHVNVGVTVQRALTMRVYPPSPRYDTPTAARALYNSVSESVARLPGVETVGWINHLPLSGANIATKVVAGEATSQQPGIAAFRVVSRDYFKAVGMKAIRGRLFDASDMVERSQALIVSEAFAAKFWPGREAIGQPVGVFKQVIQRSDYQEPIMGRVVGVVNDVRAWGPSRPPFPEVYVPFNENVWPSAFLVVRTSGNPGDLTGSVRRAVQEVDPTIPAADIKTMQSLFSGMLQARRLSALLVALFAAAAVALVAVGVFGTLAYAVGLRTKEIGVRLAVGARPIQVYWLVGRQGLQLGVGGVVAGVLGAMVVGRAMRSILYEVSASDPALLVSSALLMLLTTLLASVIPARRAARLDPLTALRQP
jgi:putative ABC transport system permease protein